MAGSKNIFVGIRGTVLALDPADGRQLWATRLKGQEFVNVVLDGGRLYAATRGELFCLDAATGAILWHNPLKGYGYGLVSIAGSGLLPAMSPVLTAEQRRRDAASSEAAAASHTAGPSA